MQQETSDIVERAGNQLRGFREEIVRAANADWKKTCLDELQTVTGLKINAKSPGCEVGFRAVAEYRSDFSFPSRPLLEYAERLCSAKSLCNGYAIDVAATGLVKYYFETLPPEGTEEGLFDILGSYYREEQTKMTQDPFWTATAIGGSVELYWARIAKICEIVPEENAPAVATDKLPRAKLRTVGKGPLAKVVMLHELAHYVTHQGCSDGDGNSYWKTFQFGPADVKEVVAQAATDEVICRHHQSDQALRDAFDALIEGLEENNKYRAHKAICKELKSAYTGKKSDYPDFWVFFRDEIRKGELTSVEKIRGFIPVHCLYKKGCVDSGWDIGGL